MRQRLGILIGLVLLVLILIGLNAATYVQRERTPDNEIMPNRSSFNSGATGSQALYSLLAETGRNAVRWRSPVDALLTEKRDPPATFVVIGQTRRPFDDTEVKQLLEWVDGGGRLVLIDRNPTEAFLKPIALWEFTHKTNDLEMLFGSNPADQKQMTSGMPASRPVQPSVLTRNVNAVQTSRFASHIETARKANENAAVTVTGYGSTRLTGQSIRSDVGSASTKYLQSGPPPATQSPQRDPHIPTVDSGEYEAPSFSAPVVHLIGNQRNVLVDVPYGAGEIVLLSDPYIVSNAGISLVDNAQLAVNVLTAGGGMVAFDEFHQGYGSNQNRVFEYFSGTPVIAIFGQIVLIAGLVFLCRSRRFARAVAEPEPDRLAKLEYVAAMAELQHRTRAFDLALENIYGEFRRRVSNLFGVDARGTGRRVLATMIAERIKGSADEIEDAMRKAEDIAHGETTSKKETIALAARIREIETELGMTRTVHRRTIR